MKLEKLMTLSQFVDLMHLSTVDEMVTLLGKHYHKLIPITIFKYNDFLKRPLKKGMFVNELKEPKFNRKTLHWAGISLAQKKDLEAWQEAEKEVIFKGWDKFAVGTYINDEYQVIPRKNGSFRLNKSDNLVFTRICENLHDLAEATKGELELKNVIL